MNVKKRSLQILSGLLCSIYFSHVVEAMDFPYLFKDPFGVEKGGYPNRGTLSAKDGSSVFAATKVSPDVPLSLGETLDLALSHNPQVKSSWADIKIQAGQLGEAYGAYLPTVSGGANWADDSIQYSDTRYASTHTSRFTWQMSASWKIFDFGGRSSNLLYSKHLLASAMASHDAMLQNLFSTVVQAYFDSVVAHAMLKNKISIEGLAYQTYQSIHEKEEKGAVSQSETLHAKTVHARAVLEKNRAQGQYQKSLAVLKGYLGISPDVQIAIPVDIHAAEEDTIVDKQLSELIAETERAHPAILAARKQLEAAYEQSKVIKSSGLPVLSLSTNYYQNTRQGEAVTSVGARETTVILGVSIPIFDGFASTYKIMGGQAKIDKQSAALVDVVQKVSMEVVKAQADVLAARQNLKAAQSLVDAAQQSFVVTQRKHSKGASDISDVLNAQTAVADAWSDQLQCLLEWNKARFQFLAALGKLDRQAIAPQ